MKFYLRIIIIISYVLLLLLLYFPEYDSVHLVFQSCQEINCSQVLVNLLTKSSSHYCAFYDLEDEVIGSHVQIGLLFDENYDVTYSHLEPVSSKGLMHHKFCVFDEQYVLTGSWNPTQRGTNMNDNYILFIDSKKLAQSFIDEYHHLINRSLEVRSLNVRFKESTVSLYFCPQHDCQDKVLQALSFAKYSVKILAFTFTDKEIAEQLLYLSRNNVSVEVIYEKTRITKYSTIHSFKDSNIRTLFDANPYTMHEKMIIIDDRVIILGSYNPTKGATLKNDENILIIQDVELVQSALNEYYRVRSFIVD